MIGRDRSQGGSVSIVVAGVATVALVARSASPMWGRRWWPVHEREPRPTPRPRRCPELALPGGRTLVELADDYAVRNGATLVSCDCASGSLATAVEVEVAIGPMFLAADDLTARASARAVIDVPGA